jgi:hypothetical protein
LTLISTFIGAIAMRTIVALRKGQLLPAPVSNVDSVSAPSTPVAPEKIASH